MYMAHGSARTTAAVSKAVSDLITATKGLCDAEEICKVAAAAAAAEASNEARTAAAAAARDAATARILADAAMKAAAAAANVSNSPAGAAGGVAAGSEKVGGADADSVKAKLDPSAVALGATSAPKAPVKGHWRGGKGPKLLVCVCVCI